MGYLFDESSLRGVIPVIPTPFTRSEDIDEEALGQAVEFAIAVGCKALCLPAYGSEFYKLSEEERFRVVALSVQQARGRAAIIAQSNHGSAKVAGEFARKNADLGANIIAFALPRAFAVPEVDMMRYAERVTQSVDLPVILQDFNPGGVTVGPAFCRELQQRCPNFHAIKLEEPVMGAKVEAIRAATQERLSILEGWGGIYLTELFDYGISGLMPGLGLSDLLGEVWSALSEGRRGDAYDIFQSILPLISFSLQTFELYHFVEKRLLQARGVLPEVFVRDCQWSPTPQIRRTTDELISRALDQIDFLEFSRNPVLEQNEPTAIASL